MHAPDLRQPTALASAFTPRCRSQLRYEDFVIHGDVQHAPGSGLVWRQGVQIGEVVATAFPHATATSWRACHGVKAPMPERLAADPAVARFSRCDGHWAHICATFSTFKTGLSTTAAASCATAAATSAKIGRCWMPQRGLCRSMNASNVNGGASPIKSPSHRNEIVGGSRFVFRYLFRNWTLARCALLPALAATIALADAAPRPPGLLGMR